MSVKKIVFASLCACICVVSKEMLSFLPNIELVTFLLMLYSLVFPFSFSFVVSVIFNFIEIILYGMGIWTIAYFIAWPLLVCVTYFFRNILSKNKDYMALTAGVFGLSFGTLCAIPYLFIGGFHAFYSYILSGLLFDVVHMTGNYIIMLVLFEPMYKLMKQIYRNYYL